MYWLLFYDYVDDIVDRRAPHRDAHLALAKAAHQSGVLVLAGALVEPLDGAVFVFEADDAAVVEDFVHNDPYVQEEIGRAHV